MRGLSLWGPETLKHPHIAHCVSPHLHLVQDYHTHPNWLISLWCLFKLRVEYLPLCSFECNVTPKNRRKEEDHEGCD